MEGRFQLTQPEGVDAAGWTAICDDLARVQRALDHDDPSAVIGSSKDLVETVGKAILVGRGETPNHSSASALMTAVHDSLDSRAGRGRAVDEPVRSMLTYARKLVGEVPQLRNEAGTGHGRAAPPPVGAEHASVAADAAMLWCRWALARAHEVHRASPGWLIDLLAGATFYKGDVTRHLNDIGLDGLPGADLDRLGRALAYRGGWGDTFNVWRDGVAPAISYPGSYPAAFRRGLLFGLFFNREGAIETTYMEMKPAAKLAAGLGDPKVLVELRAELETASVSGAVRDDGPALIADEIGKEAALLGAGPLRDAWLVLAGRFRPPVGDGA